jgi:HSP20 family protein
MRSASHPKRKEHVMKAVATVKEHPAATQPQPEPRAYVAPPVNIYETKDAYLLEADLPGVSSEGLEVTIEGNSLAFLGHRAEAAPTGPVVFRESNVADYRRAFELAPSIDVSKVSARMQQGLLTLTLPKAEQVKPRRIAVAE